MRATVSSSGQNDKAPRASGIDEVHHDCPLPPCGELQLDDTIKVLSSAKVAALSAQARALPKRAQGGPSLPVNCSASRTSLRISFIVKPSRTRR